MVLKKEVRIGIILVMFFALSMQTTIVTYAALPIRGSSATVWSQNEKSLLVDIRTITRNVASPSLSSLKAAGFTLVGTYIDTASSAEWTTIASFLKQVHIAGMRAFVCVMVGTPKPETSVQWVKKAASIGADVIELDELVGTLHYTKQQLLSVIDAGLKGNSKLQFIVTEFEYPDHALSNAFEWLSSYPSVRVANDDYTTMTYIDLEARLARQYGKVPATWFMFSPLGTSGTDCYRNLDVWITYAKQRNVNALLYIIDPWSVWQTQWSKVNAY
jgi:hypothetical protein